MKARNSLLVLLSVLVHVGCSTGPNEPNEGIDLVIDNGYYGLTDDTISVRAYTISFDYFVTGTVCYIDGYSMTLNDSTSVTVSWDLWKELVPGQVYNHTEKIRTPLLLDNPRVKMQGFTEGKSYADPRLKEQFTLINR